MNQTHQVFEITQDVGMFATLTYCALLAKACEEQGVEPYILVSSPLYRSPRGGDDWFGQFFGHKRLQLSRREIDARRADHQVIAIHDRGHINLFARGAIEREITNDLTAFSEARRLFDKYFFVKPEVLDHVNTFVLDNFSGDGQLGIHFRGTDHHHEYRFVDYGDVLGAAMKFFPRFPSVFIATDEPDFLAFVRSHLPGRPIITSRATPPKPHTIDQGDNYQKGFDALTDCLLLSRCQALVKTPSALSAWSAAFGTALDLVLVGKPYSNPWKHVVPWVNLNGLGYFPESLLYRWDPRTMADNRVLAIVADRPD